MERWKDFNPPPNSFSLSDQINSGLPMNSALEASQLQLVGINDLALMQRQLQQQQAGNFPSLFHQERKSTFIRPQLPGTVSSLTSYKGLQMPASNIPVTSSTANSSEFSYSGSIPTSPTTSRLLEVGTETAAKTASKKQKLLDYTHTLTPVFNAPNIAVIQPVSLDVTRDHVLKLAHKAMDDVNSLIKFLATSEPHLLNSSELTQAHHLISRFVGTFQQSKMSPSSTSTKAYMDPQIHPESRPATLSRGQQQQSSHSPPYILTTSSNSSVLQQPPAVLFRESDPLPPDATLADFTLQEVVGSGTFATARLCLFRPTGRYYCMRILSKEKIMRKNQLEHLLNEKTILQNAKHPFIIRLYQTFQDRSRIFFVMEYSNGGELFTAIRRASRFSNLTAKFYAAEIILALSYLHERNIVHRDIKPENILLDSQGHVKLIDFGFAKVVTDTTMTQCGTGEYMAPEIYLQQGHGKGADWWSFGVLIYEMLTGKTPFDPDSDQSSWEKIKAYLVKPPTPPSHFESLAKDIVNKFLVTVENRLGCGPDGVAEIKRHPWFQGTNWDAIMQRQVPGPIHLRTTSENDTQNFAKYPENPDAGVEFSGDDTLFAKF